MKTERKFESFKEVVDDFIVAYRSHVDYIDMGRISPSDYTICAVDIIGQHEMKLDLFIEQIKTILTLTKHIPTKEKQTPEIQTHVLRDRYGYRSIGLTIYQTYDGPWCHFYSMDHQFCTDTRYPRMLTISLEILQHILEKASKFPTKDKQ